MHIPFIHLPTPRNFGAAVFIWNIRFVLLRGFMRVMGVRGVKTWIGTFR